MSWKTDSVLATETAALVRDFLLYSDRLAREQVAMLAGVGVATVKRWERRLPRQLPGEIRSRLESAVRDYAPTPAPKEPLAAGAVEDA
jgi:hypothetical protein